jgi:hypothetical protein
METATTVNSMKCTVMVSAATNSIHPSAVRLKARARGGAQAWTTTMSVTTIGAMRMIRTSAIPRYGSPQRVVEVSERHESRDDGHRVGDANSEDCPR